MVQGSEAGDDHLGGWNINDSDDENPLWDSDVNEDELLGAIADVSIPGGHLDDSVALAIPPDEDTLYGRAHLQDKILSMSLDHMGWALLEPASHISCIGFI